MFRHVSVLPSVSAIFDGSSKINVTSALTDPTMRRSTSIVRILKMLSILELMRALHTALAWSLSSKDGSE